MKKLLPSIFISLMVVGIVFFVPSITSAQTFTLTIPTPPKINIIIPTITVINPYFTPTPTPVKSVTPSPTRTPTATPTKTITPTTKVTPKPTVTPIVTPKPTITQFTTDQKKAFIMQAINDYRRLFGLSTVTTNKETCDFAKVRAQEISTDFSHNGFLDRANAQMLPYPSFSNLTENIAMTSDYTRVVTLWKNSPGHAANMRANTPYVCVESYGKYYAYEGWKP